MAPPLVVAAWEDAAMTQDGSRIPSKVPDYTGLTLEQILELLRRPVQEFSSSI